MGTENEREEERVVRVQISVQAAPRIYVSGSRQWRGTAAASRAAHFILIPLHRCLRNDSLLRLYELIRRNHHSNVAIGVNNTNFERTIAKFEKDYKLIKQDLTWNQGEVDDQKAIGIEKHNRYCRKLWDDSFFTWHETWKLGIFQSFIASRKLHNTSFHRNQTRLGFSLMDNNDYAWHDPHSFSG